MLYLPVLARIPLCCLHELVVAEILTRKKNSKNGTPYTESKQEPTTLKIGSVGVLLLPTSTVPTHAPSTTLTRQDYKT